MQFKIVLFSLFCLMACTSEVEMPTSNQLSTKKTLNLYAMMQEAQAAFERRDYSFYLYKMITIGEVAPDFPYFLYEKSKALFVNDKKEDCLTTLEQLTALKTPMSLRIKDEPVFVLLKNEERFKAILAQVEAQQTAITNSEVAFQLSEKDIIPEALTHHPTTKSIYAGSIHRRKVIEIKADGTQQDFIKEGQDGILGILGIEIDVATNSLWLCSANTGLFGNNFIGMDTVKNAQSAIYRFNSETGKLIQKFEAPDSLNPFFNDLVVVDGTVYITDSYSNSLYHISKKEDGSYHQLESFVESELIQGQNGIASDGTHLFVAAHFTGVFKIDLATKKLKRLETDATTTLTGIDGLEYYKGSLIANQPDILKGVHQYHLNGNKVIKKNVLDYNHPLFGVTTTGEVMEDTFYYIANSGLEQFQEDGNLPNTTTLKPTTILKAKLITND